MKKLETLDENTEQHSFHTLKVPVKSSPVSTTQRNFDPQVSTVSIDFQSDEANLITETKPPTAIVSQQEQLNALTNPEIFSLLPEWVNWFPYIKTDPLLPLFQKYNLTLKQRFLTLEQAEQQNLGIQEIISSNSYLTLAEFCQKKIKEQQSDFEKVLEFWHYRFIALLKLKYNQNLKQETERLIETLQKFQLISLPYDFQLLLALVPAVCDQNVQLTLTRLFELLEQHPQQSEKTELMIAHCLVELKEFQLAIEIVQNLIKLEPGKHYLYSILAKIYIQLGNIQESKKILQTLEKLLQKTHQEDADKIHDLLMLNRAHVALALGDWQSACTLLMTLVSANPNNLLAIHNLCICYLYLGKLQDAINYLESLVLSTAPEKTCQHEAILFNLTTLYELSSETSFEKKKRLLETVAKYSNDAFLAECLKI